MTESRELLERRGESSIITQNTEHGKRLAKRTFRQAFFRKLPMNHICNYKSIHIEYRLTDIFDLELRDLKFNQLYSVNIREVAKDIRSGFLAMTGLQYAIYLVAISSAVLQMSPILDLDPSLNIPLLVIIAATIALAYIWRRWGIFSRGATIRLKNGEKICIVRGNNGDTFDQLISEIKKALRDSAPA